MNVSLGRWRVARNGALVKRLKGLLQHLQTNRAVRWHWVKGHSGNLGNEHADKLATAGRLGSVLSFPVPDGAPARRRLHGKQAVFAKRPVPAPEAPSLTWTELSTALVVAAESTFGRTRHNGLWSPFTQDDQVQLQWHDQQVAEAFDQVRLSVDMLGRARATEHFRKVKRARTTFRSKCRQRWMQQVVGTLHESLNCHDLGMFYKTLKQIGVSVANHSREGLELFSLDALRAQAQKSAGSVDPISTELIDRVVPLMPQSPELGDPPTDQEITEALHTLRESAPGYDEVTIQMLRFSGDRARWQLRLLIHQMWTTAPTEWESLSKQGVAIALYKGAGDRADLDNHRFIVLLSAVSRVLARILATRLSQWAEARDLLPPEQWGFRRNRSTQDCLFAARLLLEMAAEVRHGPDHNLEELLVLVFVDITKAYTRVQRQSAWYLFSRLGMPPTVVALLQGLHDNTEYRCRSRQGYSDAYQQLTGFREGCCTSPILYSLFHTWALHDFNLRRKDFVQLNVLANKPFNLRMHKQLRSKDKFSTRQLSLLSFADDATLLARGSNYATLEDLLCETLAEWKETIKPAKTKRLMIGRAGREVERPCVDSAKLLGAWLQDDAGYATEDLKRLEGARAIWRSLYRQLPRYGLTPAMKGRVVQAAVIRSLLYSTESRVVSAATMKKWQCFLNTVARGLTGRRLREMEGHMTMQDVLREAHLDTISTYIEVGQLNYLGHVARLPEKRLERALLFGWLPPEAKLPASKQPPSTRRYFWSLLKSAMEVSQITNWEHRWVQMASEEGGAIWKSIVNAWRRHKRHLETKLTWVEKHSAAATAARRAAAAQRAFDELGAQPAADGKYACPHCSDPPVLFPKIETLAKHIAP